ncbi:pyridoxamine 5'-phosphate oxidase family protein [Sphingomonas sp.]|uniref:pyridoxamine 5'-phosphate oxidase family protein n=1 Tax=Sphingomonas sp. TaxID=28214 RepID=UPI002600DB71|nr:pyridoxamine 5'-phosphate oxidase family protein [Sphingomonas sp.]MBV9528283.1 pyridoxamine 5'-phosphate oxidase family protein [Sphingomonas sp.]
MASKSLSEISDVMRDIDFCMLSTRTPAGGIASRPMSNNREVDYDGDSYFFACDSAHSIGEIDADPNVGLTYHAKDHLLGRPGIFIAIEGKAELIRDKGAFEEHWTKGLDRWFKDGVDTPGLVLIKVHAGKLHYWDGEEEGEVSLGADKAA